MGRLYKQFAARAIHRRKKHNIRVRTHDDNVRIIMYWTIAGRKKKIKTDRLTDCREHAENPYHVDELAEHRRRFRVPVPVHIVGRRPGKVHPLAVARMYAPQQQQQ